MRYIPTDSTLFIQNRTQFCSLLKLGSFVVLHSNDIMPTNADGEMPFKQNSDLFYLSGIDQEDTVLVIYFDFKKQQFSEVLFIKKTSDLIKIWEGEKFSKEKAAQFSGIADVRWEDEFYKFLHQNVTSKHVLCLNSNDHARSHSVVQTKNQRFVQYCRLNFPAITMCKISHLIYKLRYIKSQPEIDQIQKACNITSAAFHRVLKFVKSDVYEYEIEAEIIHEFIKSGSRGHAYQPIIASGADACVLHYIKNDKKCKTGDLILMDFGAEYGNYNADLTRCVPVSGVFTNRQKQIYQAVLNTMNFSKTQLVKGNTFEKYTKSVADFIEEELLQIRLLTKDHIAEGEKSGKPAYRKYFMHGVSHSLGLDVHDVDDRTIPFENGMVFTCEPGIYTLEEGIGIRLENNLVIQDHSPIDLMSKIPIEIEEIEDLMHA